MQTERLNIGVFEDEGWHRLLPLTYLRASCELRIGRDSLFDKLRTHLAPRVCGLWLRHDLSPLAASRLPLSMLDPSRPWCLVNARAHFTEGVAPPALGTAWLSGSAVVAFTADSHFVESLAPETFRHQHALDECLRSLRVERAPKSITLVDHPWQLALRNDAELRRQFPGAAIEGRVHPGVHTIDPTQIRIGRGAVIKPGVVLDASEGPIHIDQQALIEPNAVLQGPCYVGPQSIIRPAAVLRGGTCIGPVCRAGGEIEASTLHSHANKQHSGFLGHSYVGSWVNLGADTVTSDLKNTYGTVRIEQHGTTIDTGERLVGSVIGDHAKTGIGMLLPTGCMIGVAANVLGGGLAPKSIPSFGWWNEQALQRADVEKTVQVARTVMARRTYKLGIEEERVLRQAAVMAQQLERSAWSGPAAARK